MCRSSRITSGSVMLARSRPARGLVAQAMLRRPASPSTETRADDVRRVVVDDDDARVGKAVQHFSIMNCGLMGKQESYGWFIPI